MSFPCANDRAARQWAHEQGEDSAQEDAIQSRADELYADMVSGRDDRRLSEALGRLQEDMQRDIEFAACVRVAAMHGGTVMLRSLFVESVSGYARKVADKELNDEREE